MADEDNTMPERPPTLVVAPEQEDQQEATESVASPAKVLRIGSMTKELLGPRAGRRPLRRPEGRAGPPQLTLLGRHAH